MAVAFVKHLGVVDNSNSTTSVITIPAGGVAIGNKVLIRGVRGASGVTVSSVADTTGTNVYAEVVRQNAANPSVFLWVGTIAAALVSGNTITMTYSSKGGNGAAADEFSGLTVTADGTNSATGSSTTPSTNITPANAADLVYGAVAIVAGGADSFTEDADTDAGDSWHGLTPATYTSGNNSLRGAYKITTSAATDTYNPTLGTSRAWAEILAALQETVTAAVIPSLVTARRV